MMINHTPADEGPRGMPPDKCLQLLEATKPGDEIRLRGIVVRHVPQDRGVEVVIMDQPQRSILLWLPEATWVAEEGLDPGLGNFEPGAEVQLKATALHDSGEYVEVAFPALDGENSHTVWLEEGTVVQLPIEGEVTV